MLIKTRSCLPQCVPFHKADPIIQGLLVAPHYPQMKIPMRLVVTSMNTY